MNIRKVVKSIIPKELFEKVEPVGHLVESFAANLRYGFPGRKIRVIGVTGTNGKTTTTLMIYKMLSEAGVKVGFMSTVAYGMNGEIIPNNVHMTTTQAGKLQKKLKEFGDAGVEWVIVETSSFALAQNRVWGVPYEIAILTNLTHDHLEYHKTFENYREAKRKLFKIANKHGLKYGIVNADDPNAELFASSVKNSTSFGIKRGNLKAEAIKLSTRKTTYRAVVGEDSYSITVNIPGEFNVSNSLAAVAVGRKIGLTKKQIEKGIAALESVEGRMNLIEEGQPFQVIIDFASTPDGFEKFFSTVRPLVKGKLVAVFGSAGRRDQAKRAIQGKIAGKYADVVIITEEDNRDEDGQNILGEIAKGAEKSGKVRDNSLFLIPDREEAIGFALTIPKNANDTVVLLGKGHEKTIERASGEHPWNEAEVTRVALQELLKTKI
ncbi:MAG: UDP-N-acetylmuramoyl-L-alanyl-D-glutamate--2,6-diaminopimelate ligase [Candidatus Microsaccharimonas sp.]